MLNLITLCRDTISSLILYYNYQQCGHRGLAKFLGESGKTMLDLAFKNFRQ